MTDTNDTDNDGGARPALDRKKLVETLDLLAQRHILLGKVGFAAGSTEEVYRQAGAAAALEAFSGLIDLGTFDRKEDES